MAQKGKRGAGRRGAARAARARGWHDIDRTVPHVLAAEGDAGAARLKVVAAENPLAEATLCDAGVAARIDGPERFAEATLALPLRKVAMRGVDPATVRLFRVEEKSRALVPIWRSGVNRALRSAWARVRRPGTYVAIGLPRDPLLREMLRALAIERRLRDADERDRGSLTKDTLRGFLELPEDAIEEVRRYLTRLEIQSGVAGLEPGEVEMDTGGHPRAFVLPGGASLGAIRGRLERLGGSAGGLPEEALFFPPVVPQNGEPPWDRPAQAGPWNGADWRALDTLSLWARYPYLELFLPCWLFSQDWWMHQHDVRHTGHASGASDISAATVSGLYLHAKVAVDGPVVTKPSIVDGKVYVGSGKSGGVGGTLYKIDLAGGTIDTSLATAGSAFYSWVSGIGGSPAVVGNRVYFTGVHGTVYCIDATTFAPVWSVSLKTADEPHNQPLNNPNSDCWSGPLVVNGKVYVGCGEGESASTYGFVFCLDACTGNVLWCFCTCKLSAVADNQPNHIPTAIAAPWAAAHGFTVVANPVETGSSVWSSCVYDRVHDAVYVGTGNSQYPHTAQPDEYYGSGLISLNASTGAFRGFFQPAPDDSYFPGDSDIDVPGAPSVYWLGTRRVVAFGSKNGSFFVLDAGDLSVVARRQLLPRIGGTGLPGDRGTASAEVVPNGGTGENSYGIFGTPAIHFGSGRLFVGLGGYNGMALDGDAGIDQTRTPFVRAVHWDDLHDAWPTALGADNVLRYTATKPPMYSSREVGLSSPAVVADVVFVSTSPPPGDTALGGLYALSVADGHCLWSAGGLSAGVFALGPAIYGNFVVVGSGNWVYIYKLGPCWRFPIPPLWRKPWPWEIVEGKVPFPADPPIGPWPGPDPSPIAERPAGARPRGAAPPKKRPARRRR